MGTYPEDRRWADLWIPKIKKIVGPLLLVETSNEIDVSEAADLMVFTARDMRIAARVRRPGYAKKYGYEFTIRARRDSGVETELSKIVNGWGDWFFYGHSDEEEQFIDLWWLINLHHFRAALICQAQKNGYRIKSIDKDNGDGTYFKAFDLRSFPEHPPILVAQSAILPAMEAAA